MGNSDKDGVIGEAIAKPHAHVSVHDHRRCWQEDDDRSLLALAPSRQEEKSGSNLEGDLCRTIVWVNFHFGPRKETFRHIFVVLTYSYFVF